MLGSLLVPHNVWTGNVVFLGVVNGLIFGLIAMGIVLIYRSSRVINFAVGEIGVPAAAVLAIMVGKSGWPYWPSLIFALFVGTAAGAVVELTVIRRLFKAPRVIVLVATIGVAELAQAVTLYLPGYRDGNIPSSYPSPMNSQWDIGNVTVSGPQLLALIAVPAITIFLWWLLGHTHFGEAVRAAATNADLARLTGVSPKLVSTAIWTIAGFISAVSVILYSTINASSAAQVVTIGPDTLLFGLVAALIGRMTSFPKAFAGGILVGLFNQLISYNVTNNPGTDKFILFLLTLVLVARMSRSDETGGESFAFAPRVPHVPERLRDIWWVRRMPNLLGWFALAVAVVLPFVINKSSTHQTYTVIAAVALCAVSVTVLTGWAGQLSLGQMAFAGVAALSTATLVRGLTLNIGWRSHRLVKGAMRPIPFWMAVICVLLAATAFGFMLQRGTARRIRLYWGLAALGFIAGAVVLFPASVDRSGTPHSIPFVISMLMGATIACALAVSVGIGALRVKGLLLAISTMAFAIAAAEYVFPRPILSGGEGILSVDLPRGKLGPIDLTLHNRAYFYFVLFLLTMTLILIGHLRRTGIGRIVIGVRENEPGAAALTISATRAKLIAFAVSGFIAGLGGAALGGVFGEIGYGERFFRVEDSLTLVSMAVIGGLGSLGGAVGGALWVQGLQSLWPSNETVPLLTSSIGLLIILMYLPGGFTQIAYYIRSSILGQLEKRLPERPVKTVTAPPAALTHARTTEMTLNDDGSVIATHGLTVTFGGLVAVDGVDFRANPNEVIGLIGTNGAGKSTLLNAIGGYVPSSGSVQLLGEEISGLPAHRRARVGLGRTFQAATLFPELTVRESVQLALEARERTPFWGSLFYWSYAKERRKRAESAELIDFLGLGRYADRFIAELSTGTRRIVELASVLAVAPRVICLDEPTAGVAQREAEAFGPLIKSVQRELDATLIVVEHDLPLIMSISDRVYCLEAGAIIAEGDPETVRNDDRVVSSYLGTDERAIQRSDSVAPTEVTA